MDEAPDGAAGTDAGDTDDAASTSQSQGLGAFEDGASPASNGDATRDDAAGTDAGTDDAGAGAVEEFTGTVVQAGNPVVLDDGTETRSVETAESLQLGAEVTVRGPVRDGRIEATDVESVTR
jgi:replication factor A1